MITESACVTLRPLWAYLSLWADGARATGRAGRSGRPRRTRGACRPCWSYWPCTTATACSRRALRPGRSSGSRSPTLTGWTTRPGALWQTDAEAADLPGEALAVLRDGANDSGAEDCPATR